MALSLWGGERDNTQPPMPQTCSSIPSLWGKIWGKMVRKLLPLPRHHAKALTEHFFGVEKAVFLVKFPAWGRALTAARSEAILGSLLGGESGQTQSSPSPSFPGNSPIWGESGTNTNFLAPYCSCRPCFGVFLPQSGSRRLLWRGQGRRGLQKTPTRPPHTHPVSTIAFFGGKSGRIGQTARRPRLSAGFGGDLGSGGARMPRPGGSPLSPRLPTPQNGRNRPKFAAPPPPTPPRAGPGGEGGSGWGRGAPGTCRRRFRGVWPQI